MERMRDLTSRERKADLKCKCFKRLDIGDKLSVASKCRRLECL